MADFATRGAFASTAILMALALAPAAQAQVVHRFDLPVQSLAVSLREVGLKTRVNITFDPADVRLKTAPALHGDLSVEEALSRLVASSGLRVTTTSSGSFVIVAAPIPNRSLPSAGISSVIAEPKTLVVASAQASAPANTISDLVVTGSRTITNGFAAPTPVTVLSTEALLEKSPTTIPDALRQLPEFVNSTGPHAAQAGGISNPAGAAGGSAATYLNLRGLGSNRTLVLQDGRRTPPTTSTGAVNADLFPQMLVQRVEVVTGGASAAYGSDAISGVVNFITDKKFQGVKGLVQAGQASRGDMKSYRLGIAAGASLVDDRLHIIGSAEDYYNQGIPTQRRRGYGDNKVGAGGQFGAVGPNGARAGSADNPYISYYGVRAIGSSFTGVASSGPFAGSQILNGQLVPLNQGTTITPQTCINCDANYYQMREEAGLVPRVHNSQAYLRAEFEINDHITSWAQLSYARSKIYSLSINNNFNRSITIFSENAFLPSSAKTALGNLPSFTYSKAFGVNQLPQNDVNLEPQSLNFLAGLEGALGETWKWDATYVSGKTETDFHSRQRNYRNAFASFDAVVDPASQNIVCRVTLTNPGVYPGCVPLNLFMGVAPASQEYVAYIMGDSTFRDTEKSRALEVNLRGQPFSLWAGPVSLAAGAEYRRQSYGLESNSGPDTYATQGIRGLGVNNLFQLTNISPSNGVVKIKEFYGEIFIPLAKDLPLIKSIDIDLAARSTDYSTSGRVTTWKVGSNYQPLEGLRFRATLSRDIRAPSLGELFGGQTNTNAALVDLHANSPRITITQRTGGNPNLKPEVSKTVTFGAVFEPSWLPGLRASVDYYRFKISDAIAAPFTAQQINDVCDASGGGDPVICPLIERPFAYSNTTPANAVRAVNVLNVNVSQFNVSGIDFEVDYRRDLFGGQMNTRILASYLEEYAAVTAPGQPSQQFAGNVDGTFGSSFALPLPKLQASAQVRYTSGPLGMSVQLRRVGKLKQSIVPTNVYADNVIPAEYYADLNVTYELEGRGVDIQLFGNVANLFDNQPPLVAHPTASVFGAYPALSTIHDVVGTNVTAGVRFRF